MDPPNLRGRLLVAAPTLVDPNFVRTVVLVLDHDDEGAVGVILNRPSDTSVSEALPGWGAVASEPADVFVGGPVQPEAAVCLATVDGDESSVSGFTPLLGWVGSLDLSQDPLPVQPDVIQLRVFAGYAGWAPGQLEMEASSGDWFVLEALPTDPFDTDPDGLWRQVLRRQRGELRVVADYPPHPSLN